MTVSDVGREGVRLVSQLTGVAISVPVVAGFVLLGAAVLVGRSLLAKVNRNLAHVTYVAAPTLDYPALGFVAGHAYWLSGITLRSSTPPATGGHAQGTIDALSYGFGVGDPTPSGTQFGTGTLTGGNLPTPLVYTRQYQTRGPAPSIPRAKRIDLTARNIAAVTINVQRASVGCGVDLHVDTDGPITIELAGCRRTVVAGGA